MKTYFAKVHKIYTNCNIDCTEKVSYILDSYHFLPSDIKNCEIEF